MKYFYILKLCCLLALVHALAPQAFAQSDPFDSQWEPQTVIIKISAPAMLDFNLKIAEGNNRTGLTGLDLALSAFGQVEFEQVFRTDPRFVQRHQAAGLDRWFFVRFDEPLDEKAFAAELRTLPEIDSALLNLIVEDELLNDFRKAGISEAPFRTNPLGSNDPLLEEQWYLNNTGQTGGTPGADANVFPAWELTTGSPDVVVLTLETGIDLNHPDLVNRLWINPNPGSENGYEGDLHGWNFFNDNNNIQDPNGTGTLVAGLVAAEINNGVDIAGVAGGNTIDSGVRIMTATVAAGANFWMPAAVAQALVYGTDNGAVITTHRWPIIDEMGAEAIDYFRQFAGVDPFGRMDSAVVGGVVFFSAGNTASDLIPDWADLIESPFFITATDHNDQLYEMANRGEWIGLSVPGTDILGLWIDGGTDSFSGAGIAAMLASGAAALLASHAPGISGEELLNRLRASSDNIDGMNPGFEGMLAGRLNLMSALSLEPSDVPPSAVSDLDLADATAENFANISWTAPGAFGDEGLAQNYLIRVSQNPITEENFDDPSHLQFVKPAAHAGFQESFRITGLNPQTGYYAALKTRNGLGGISEISNVISFTTDGSPALLVSVSDELNVILRAGESATRTITLSNPGEGTLHYAFPAHLQDGTNSVSMHVALTETHEPVLDAAGISRLLEGRINPNSSVGSNNIILFERDDNTPFVEYAFENLTLSSFQSVIIADNIYFGNLIAVGADFTLVENNGDPNDPFFANDLSVTFFDGQTTPLLVGGLYGGTYPEMYGWTTGEDSTPGTVVREVVMLNEPFPIDNMVVRLLNNYFGGFPADATWSGSVFFYGVQEKPQYITEVTPASGSLMPGESVEVTLTYTTPQTGHFETALVVRSNDLSATSQLVETSLLVTENLDFAGLLSPSVHEMETGESVSINASALLEGLTGSGEAPDGLSFEVAFSAKNTHPNTWPEESWISGSFTETDGASDFFEAFAGSELEEGTWYFAARFTYEGFYAYGGYSETGGGFWDGDENVSGILTVVNPVNTEPDTHLPTTVALLQNYPNPFNPTTMISWELPFAAEVQLDVYNISGQLVARLVNEVKAAGNHQVSFNAANLSSGIYLYRLQTTPTGSDSANRTTVQTRKMTLIK